MSPETLLKSLRKGPGTGWAVGVSGGPDSLGLLAWLKPYAEKLQIPLYAVIVNHGLRPEAKAEAEQVLQWVTRFGVLGEVRTLSPKQGGENLQTFAREGRYEAFDQFMQGKRLSHLFLGHTQEDQAETLLHRFLRGTDYLGAQGMHPLSSRITDTGYTYTLARPFLDNPKTELHQHWKTKVITDPSNHNPDFSRVRHRHFLEQETPHELLVTAQKFSALGKAHEEALQPFWKNSYACHDGWGSLNREAFRALPPLHQDMVLRRILQTYGTRPTQGYPPRTRSLETLLPELLDGKGKLTVHGTLIEIQPQLLRFSREFSKISAKALPLLPHGMMWDHRYKIAWTDKTEGLAVHALGPLFSQLREYTDTPYEIGQTFPGIFRNKDLVAHPLEGEFISFEV